MAGAAVAEAVGAVGAVAAVAESAGPLGLGLALPFLLAMRERYPDVRLRLVESLPGSLAAMLNARQLDLAVVFDAGSARRWSVLPMLAGWLLTALEFEPIHMGLALTAAFPAVLAGDAIAVRRGLAPPWYLALRVPLTVVATLCLAASSLRFVYPPGS